MNDVNTTFPNQEFIGFGGEVYLQAISNIYKYNRTVDTYQDDMA